MSLRLITFVVAGAMFAVAFSWLIDHHAPSWVAMLVAIVIVAVAMTLHYVMLDIWRPAEDRTRLAAYIQASGAEALSIEPHGAVIGGRSTPDFRKYLVRLRRSDGGEEERVLGVEVALLGEPQVRGYAAG